MSVQKLYTQLFRISIIVLTLFLLVPLTSTAQARPSEAMQELQRYVQKTVPVNWKPGIDHARRTFPIVYAIGMGWGMQCQRMHAAQDSAKLSDVEALKQEIIADLKSLARECNYKNPQNGSPMQTEKLLGAFNNSMSGRLNDWAHQNLKFKPTAIQMPFIANRGTAPLAKLQRRKSTIKLLGEEAGPAVDSNAETIKSTKVQSQNLTGLICPMQRPPRSNKQLYWLSSTAFRLPNDGVMNDKKCIQCTYRNNGSLYSQTEYAIGEVVTVFNFTTQRSVHYLRERYEKIDDGKISSHYHGTKEEYNLSKNGQPYLWKREQWRNGKRHGKSETFDILPSGKIFLQNDYQYANGKQHGLQTGYYLDKKTGKSYLVFKNIYRNGQLEKSTAYNKDGSIRN